MADFSKFDQRSNSDKGVWFDILHPASGDPISEGGKVSRFLIRGAASREAQRELREAEKAAVKSSGDDEVQNMDQVHEMMINAAVPFIVDFENVEIEGKKLTGAEEDVRRFLDLTYPVMSPTPDGYELANNPFAKQAIDNVAKHEAFLGNG